MTIHSKDAQGSCEDAVHIFGALRPRVYELRPPLVVLVISGHSSWRRHGGVLIIHLKDAHGPCEDVGSRIGALPPRVYELRPPLVVLVRGGHNL